MNSKLLEVVRPNDAKHESTVCIRNTLKLLLPTPPPPPSDLCKTLSEFKWKQASAFSVHLFRYHWHARADSRLTPCGQGWKATSKETLAALADPSLRNQHNKETSNYSLGGLCYTVSCKHRSKVKTKRVRWPWAQEEERKYFVSRPPGSINTVGTYLCTWRRCTWRCLAQTVPKSNPQSHRTALLLLLLLGKAPTKGTAPARSPYRITLSSGTFTPLQSNSERQAGIFQD